MDNTVDYGSTDMCSTHIWSAICPLSSAEEQWISNPLARSSNLLAGAKT